MRKTAAARLAFAWFVAGNVLGAVVLAVITDDAGSTFLAPRPEAEAQDVASAIPAR